MLTVAIPRDGELAVRAASLMLAAGYPPSPRTSGASPELESEVKLFRLPERDLAIYALRGGLNLALCGSLALDEASTSPRVLLDVEPSLRELALFSSDQRITVQADLAGARVATPYPHILRRHLASRGIAARDVITLDPVDHAHQLGIADALGAVVDRTAQLPKPFCDMRRLGTVKTCDLVVIEGSPPLEEADRSARDRLLGQLRAAQLAETMQLVQYDCPTAQLERTVNTLHATDSIEISPPRADSWSTVRVLLPRPTVPKMAQRLLALGCRRVLTFDPGTYHPGPAGHDAAAERPAGRSAPALPGPRTKPATPT